MVTGKLNRAALQSCQSFTEQHFYSWYKNTFHKTQLAPVEIIQTLESEAVCFCCRREPSIIYKNVCCKSNFTYHFSFLYQRTLWPNSTVHKASQLSWYFTSSYYDFRQLKISSRSVTSMIGMEKVYWTCTTSWIYFMP